MGKNIGLYIDSMQIGGAQRVMNNLAIHFVEQGHNVILINDIVPEETKNEYSIDNRVERVFLDDKKRGRIGKNLHRILSLRRMIVEKGIDVVISFLGPPNIRLLVGSLFLDVKKIVSVRNDPYIEYGTCIKRIISNIVFCLCDVCVFQTIDASLFFSKGIRSKSRIILNPVSERFYDTEWIGEDSTEIAIVGRLEAQKNPLLAIEAFSKISEEYPEEKLVFYGAGSLEEAIIDEAKKHGVGNRVSVFGQTNNIDSVLAKSKLFVMASDYEGLPNALMEAMSVGIPVISTDCPCGGPKALITKENEGILVPCGDSDAMSNAIRVLLSSKEKRDELHEGEKKRAAEFASEKIFREWDSIL